MGGKLKTNKSVAKRIRVNKNGKMKKARAGKRHLLQHKSRNRKRTLRKQNLVESGAFQSQIRRLMPYA
jgi:large subunit ribosomal protein L35